MVAVGAFFGDFSLSTNCVVRLALALPDFCFDRFEFWRFCAASPRLASPMDLPGLAELPPPSRAGLARFLVRFLAPPLGRACFGTNCDDEVIAGLAADKRLGLSAIAVAETKVVWITKAKAKEQSAVFLIFQSPSKCGWRRFQ